MKVVKIEDWLYDHEIIDVADCEIERTKRKWRVWYKDHPVGEDVDSLKEAKERALLHTRAMRRRQ